MPTLTSHIPAIVQDVEITEAAVAVPAGRDDGMRVAEAWLLVRRYTEPLDLVRLAVPEAGLTSDDVSAALAGSAASLSVRSDYLEGRARALASAPALTVVVCTRNRPESLARALKSVLCQGYPALRVLVVDNAPSDDATRAVARAAGVDYLAVEEPGLSRARNAAVRATAGQTVAWLDDDEVADPYWLSEIARGLAAHPEAEVLCGSVVPAELETPAQLWFEQFGGLVKGRGFRPVVFSPATRRTHHPLFPLPPFGAGANMVTRPGVVERLGGFDVALGAGSPAMGGEDTLFFSLVLRSGGTIAYQPTILARHYHRRDLDGLRSQLVGYGTGLTAAYTALVRRHPTAIASLAALAPRAARELLGGAGHRTATIGADFPTDLLQANRRAMVRGPSAYREGRVHPAAPAPGSGRPDTNIAGEARVAPVRLAFVQVGSDVIGDLPTALWPPSTGDHVAVRVFVLRGGRPVGEVTLAGDGEGIDAEEVRRRVSAVVREEPTVDAVELGERAPFVSVIVASSFARRELLARSVAALARLDYPDYEVVVVDNRPVPDPASWSTLQAHPRTRVVSEPRPGASAARNRGLREAAGEIVAFTDDDTVVDPGWLRALAGRFLAEPDVDCVTGLVLPGELVTPAQVWFEASGNAFGQKYAQASYAGDRFTVANRCAPDPYRRTSVYRLGEYGTGSNMAFRASVIRDLGGFDEALGPGTPAMAGEDILLFLRLLSGGGRLAYEPAAYVRHWHRREFDALVHQTHSYGVGLTAMLTAAVRRDPRQLWGLARTLLPGITLLVRGEATAPGASAAAPAALVAAKRRGMLIGPVAYLRGRRRMRAWR